MGVSPIVVQSKATGATGGTSHTGTVDNDGSAGNIALCIGFTTANDPDQVLTPDTFDPDWVLITTEGVHSLNSGSPCLWAAYRRILSTEALTAQFQTVSAAPIRTHMYEIGGTDPSDTTPFDNYAQDIDNSSGSTSCGVGPIADTTVRSGLTIAACAMTPSPSNTPTASNGYGNILHEAGLVSARLAHDGLGPFSTTFSWTGGSTPRAFIINFFSASDATIGMRFNWGWTF